MDLGRAEQGAVLDELPFAPMCGSELEASRRGVEMDPLMVSKVWILITLLVEGVLDYILVVVRILLVVLVRRGTQAEPGIRLLRRGRMLVSDR